MPFFSIFIRKVRYEICTNQFKNQFFHMRRPVSTSSSLNIHLNLSHPIYMIWGSNTGVGKTLISTGIASSVLSSSSSSSSRVTYIKPVQTGFPHDSDSRFVYRKISDIFLGSRVDIVASNQVLKASETVAKGAGFEGKVFSTTEKGFVDIDFYEEGRIGNYHCDTNASKLICKTIYGWNEPISPHLVAEKEGSVVSDSMLLESLQKFSESCEEDKVHEKKKKVWTIIETAGGVASPGPSGSLQCDIYRPFRFPSVLVGDGKLGGISGTISAYESLKLRGYDVEAIILEDHGLSNEVPLLSYLRNKVPVLVLPPIPKDPSNNLVEWFHKSRDVFNSLKEIMFSAYSERIERLRNMPENAQTILWWPFTQHRLIPEHGVTVIDSRNGENFAVHKVESQRTLEHLTQQFDACASWWTQGPDNTLQIELARDIGYAAARYGHVMFPENVYEPVLQCAELLLEGVGKGWASRVFFSDNGSTAIEIALKMAFRKFSFDHGLLDNFKQTSEGKSIDFKVLALNGSYHGDTLGAMEAQAPSSYTGFLQHPWYEGRGLFLDPPTIILSDGKWSISLPKVLRSYIPKPEEFSSRDELFQRSRDSSVLADTYLEYISQEILKFAEQRKHMHIGAIIIEPVIHAAGGMHMIDPLFQRVLVKEGKNQKIPIIFDEVFTGFWRLGVESAAELLDCHPDVACYAKLMSGGVVPLAATLSTDAVFKAFSYDSKLMALLHGHSYSAHAIGCMSSTKAIKWFKNPQTNFNIVQEEGKLRELWDMKLVNEISHLSTVRRVVTLGTLFALELRVNNCNTGYGSLCASSVIQQLREDGIYMRPLGNVLYIMCGPCTSPHVSNLILSKLKRRIQEFNSDDI